MLSSSRMSSANNVLAQELSLSPSELWPQSAKERSGKAEDSTSSGPCSCPQESPTQIFHTVKPLENQQTLHLASRSVNEDVLLMTNDPLTNIDNAAALSTNDATESTGICPGNSRARPQDQSLPSLESPRCHHNCVYTRGPYLREQQNRCNRQNSIYRRTF